MHNARKVSKIRTLREHVLKVKGVKFQRQNDTRLSDDENKDEGLYNELSMKSGIRLKSASRIHANAVTT